MLQPHLEKSLRYYPSSEYESYKATVQKLRVLLSDVAPEQIRQLSLILAKAASIRQCSDEIRAAINAFSFHPEDTLGQEFTELKEVGLGGLDAALTAIAGTKESILATWRARGLGVSLLPAEDLKVEYLSQIFSAHKIVRELLKLNQGDVVRELLNEIVSKTQVPEIFLKKRVKPWLLSDLKKTDDTTYCIALNAFNEYLLSEFGYRAAAGKKFSVTKLDNNKLAICALDPTVDSDSLKSFILSHVKSFGKVMEISGYRYKFKAFEGKQDNTAAQFEAAIGVGPDGKRVSLNVQAYFLVLIMEVDFV